jgi:hypothetical protein
VSFHGVTVHTEKNDICDKSACPIAPGEFVLKNTEVLPGITPPVGIGVFLLAKLFCSLLLVVFSFLVLVTLYVGLFKTVTASRLSYHVLCFV